MPSKIACVSGGFDPLHVGHIRLIEAASRYGSLTVILNSDAWLLRKKGYCLMDWTDRAEVLMALRAVSTVVPVEDSDGTVCEALRWIRPRFFCNGGDRIEADPREAAVCQEFGINQVFNVGGGKVRSSQEIVRSVRDHR